MKLIFFLLIGAPAYAAISASTVWEVRTTGADTNGGGFVTGASGTDYSVNDNKNATSCTSCGSSTADLSKADAVANGTTTITSATAAFSSAIVGNIIRLNGGTGSLTAVWRQVTAFTNSTTITVDATVATGTGITMNIGGGLLTVSQSFTNSVANNMVWLKAGTYTVTADVVMNAANLTLTGYSTSRGDRTTKPIITSATNSVNLIDVEQSNFTLSNVSFTHTASTRGMCLQALVAHTGGHLFIDSIFDGCQNGINGDNVGAHFRFNSFVADNIEVKNSVSAGITIASGGNGHQINNSYIHNNGGDGVNMTSPIVSLTRSEFYSNSTSGATLNVGLITIVNCGFDSNTSDGLTVTSANVAAVVDGNIFTNNTGWGSNFGSSFTGDAASVRTNAYYNNGSGARRSLPAGTGDVTLTGSPYTSAGTSDFSLNSTTGAGTACKGVGFPGTAASGIGHADIGPLQSAGSSSTTVNACTSSRLRETVSPLGAHFQKATDVEGLRESMARYGAHLAKSRESAPVREKAGIVGAHLAKPADSLTVRDGAAPHGAHYATFADSLIPRDRAVGRGAHSAVVRDLMTVLDMALRRGSRVASSNERTFVMDAAVGLGAHLTASVERTPLLDVPSGRGGHRAVVRDAGLSRQLAATLSSHFAAAVDVRKGADRVAMLGAHITRALDVLRIGDAGRGHGAHVSAPHERSLVTDASLRRGGYLRTGADENLVSSITSRIAGFGARALDALKATQVVGSLVAHLAAAADRTATFDVPGIHATGHRYALNLFDGRTLLEGGLSRVLRWNPEVRTDRLAVYRQILRFAIYQFPFGRFAIYPKQVTVTVVDK